MSKSDGLIRWETKLSPGDGNRYALAAKVFVGDDGPICVGRYQVPPIVDVVDRRTGKILSTHGYGWQRLKGVLGVGKFAIVCTSDPNFVSKVQLHELDLVTGRVRDGVSQYVLGSLWRPYYTFGGEIFQFKKNGSHSELAPLTLFTGGYDVLHEPKNIWLLPKGRALVTSFNPDEYPGYGIRLSLWSLDPLKELWVQEQDNYHFERTRDFIFTRDVVQVEKDVWLDSEGKINRLVGDQIRPMERKEGVARVFECRGHAFEIDNVWDGPKTTYRLQELQTGGAPSKAISQLSKPSGEYASFETWGQSILMVSGDLTSDQTPRTLCLMRVDID
ncbi:MAG: hypothetical protein P4L46_02800 [Fimbriimonas sp.]|nr:hypothetical protein [Fimbriimonas sp.]